MHREGEKTKKESGNGPLKMQGITASNIEMSFGQGADSLISHSTNCKQIEVSFFGLKDPLKFSLLLAFVYLLCRQS